MFFAAAAIAASRYNHVTANITASIVLAAMALANVAEAAVLEYRQKNKDPK